MEVTSAAPLVQADNADLSTNFNQSMIANMPNGGNDMSYIAQTAPGVTMDVGGGYGNFSCLSVFPPLRTCSRSTVRTTWIRT